MSLKAVGIRMVSQSGGYREPEGVYQVVHVRVRGIWPGRREGLRSAEATREVVDQLLLSRRARRGSRRLEARRV
jgi:hypothetical protein